MTLISIVLVLAVVGFLCWLILMIPMPTLFKNIILGVVGLFAVLWVLQTMGISTGLPMVRLR